MELGQFFQQVASRCGVMLIEHRTSGARRSPSIKLVVDTEDGVTIGEIEQVTRILKDSAEMGQHFPDGFHLEVTSPGLDCPLREEYQFRRNLNRPVRVSHADSEVPNPLEGNLKSVENDQIVIESAKSEFSLELDVIIEGRLILK